MVDHCSVTDFLHVELFGAGSLGQDLGPVRHGLGFILNSLPETDGEIRDPYPSPSSGDMKEPRHEDSVFCQVPNLRCISAGKCTGPHKLLGCKLTLPVSFQ